MTDNQTTENDQPNCVVLNGMRLDDQAKKWRIYRYIVTGLGAEIFALLGPLTVVSVNTADEATMTIPWAGDPVISITAWPIVMASLTLAIGGSVGFVICGLIQRLFSWKNKNA
jgi:hypothetical protein